ncbi:hypothetical protein [Myxosarcina sp. GI1]|uniref:hypothetical protein n=1 Tax=Myxosarcina sp. GI1 TaxID=1541065 RepID=UPI00068B3A17|nr:hypothetical protein [Myxosarcina sp. GI1]
MPDKYRETKNNWDKNNPEKIKQSKAKYDKENPTWSFRPTPELREWLKKERWDDRDGNPETNAALVIRKLEKLMEMEYQGY